VSLPWQATVQPSPEGGYRLFVQGLRDFEMFAATEQELRDEFKDALRSHLAGYIAINKVVPTPPAWRVAQNEPRVATLSTQPGNQEAEFEVRGQQWSQVAA